MTSPQASRIVQLAAAALAGALIAGGSLAIASTHTDQTIHGCVVRHAHQPGLRPGELLIARRCTRGQSAIRWAHQGPVGPRGRTGQTGPAGPAGGASDWAIVNGINPAGSNNPSLIIAGQNITAQYLGAGDYQITAGGPCAGQPGAANVTIEQNGFSQRFVDEIQRPSPFSPTFQVKVFADSGGTLTPQDGAQLNVTYTCQANS